MVSSFVSGVSYEILPLRIFSLVKTGVTPEVNALATIMIVLSLALVVLASLLHEKITINKQKVSQTFEFKIEYALTHNQGVFFMPVIRQVVFLRLFTENKQK